MTTTTTTGITKQKWQQRKKVRWQNITLSADAEQIASARRQAQRSGHSLNSIFREWLADYTKKKEAMCAAKFDAMMKQISYVTPGRKFTREEMNER